MAGLIVPITTGDRAKRPTSPPPEPFALMAAAQMHAEGRLVQPVSMDQSDRNAAPKPLLEAGGGRSLGGSGEGVKTYGHPQHLENAASEWARGNMTGKEFRDMVRKEGWSIDPYELQRSRKGTIDVFDPSGKMHELTP